MADREQSPDRDDWLLRESLKLMRLINLAGGAPITRWPLDSVWTGIFQDLEDGICRGELPAGAHKIMRFQTVRLFDLWAFIRDRDERWQPLRNFCERWAAVRKCNSHSSKRRTGFGTC